MKKYTFEDIEFEPHYTFNGGVMGKLFFDNGYGISVINGEGSFTEDNEHYEIAVLQGNEADYDLCYTTTITDDVIGYLSISEVNEYISKIQNLQ